MIQAKPTVFPFLISFLLVGTFAQAQNSPIKNSSTLWHQVEAFTSTIVVRPDDYDSTIAHTLVIALHGFGGTAESFLGLSEPFTDFHNANYMIFRSGTWFDENQEDDFFLFLKVCALNNHSFWIQNANVTSCVD